MIRLDAATWNAHYPVGTTVIFELVRGRPETREIRKTRSVARDTVNGAMVWLEGRAGGCCCDHMAAIKIPTPVDTDRIRFDHEPLPARF